MTTADHPLLLVLNKHDDTMCYVDPLTLEPIARVPAGHDPHEVVIARDQGFAYVSNYAPPGNTISVIHLTRRTLHAQIPTEPFVRIHGAAIAPDGMHAYFTAGQTGYIVEVDARANEVTRGIPTHGEISHMVLVSPDGGWIYTANIGSRNVSVIDRESGDLMTQVPCDAGCEGMAFAPDGGHLWAANQDAASITIVDMATHRVVATMPCPGVPLRIRFTDDGSLALVTNWVAEGELVVIDVAQRREVKRLRVGNQPIGVTVSPDGARAFVTNMSSDDIHVIDMGSLSVAGRFSTGAGPDAMAWWYSSA